MIHLLPLVMEIKDMVVSTSEMIVVGYPRRPIAIYSKSNAHHGIFGVYKCNRCSRCCSTEISHPCSVETGVEVQEFAKYVVGDKSKSFIH